MTPAARASLLALVLAFSSPLAACASSPKAPPPAQPGHGGHGGHGGHPHDASGGSVLDEKLAEVARAHGGSGPWAVAGYRMGEHALAALDLPRGSFDLEVVHHTPHEVQYACIADGASASTGASTGKLNLTLEPATAADTHTTYRKKSTGQTITLRVSKAFVARFANVPRDRLAAAGREAMGLPDADVFEVVPAGA